MADIDVVGILKQLGETDLGKQLLDVLTSTEMPKVIQKEALGEGTHGNYSPGENTVKLNWRLPYSDKDIQTNVVAHELMHAANTQMGNAMYGKGSKFPKDLKAEIDKFSTWQGEVPFGKLIEKTEPGSFYRSDWGERNAFGVGNTLAKKSIRPVSHADATAATENAIKMDLFLRGFKQMKAQK